MDLKEIKTVIDLMTKNGLTEFELEKDQFKIRICKDGQSGGASQPPYLIQPSSPQVQNHPPQHAYSAPIAESAPKSSLPSINSPMVGTFYMSPSPESSPYAQVGTQVNEESVVCIIEAMKVMNEIKAEMKGIISEVVAENGKPVEFGQPLFRITPA